MKRLLVLFALLLVLAGCAALPQPATAPVVAEDSARYIVLAVANPVEATSRRAGSSLGAYSTPPRYVVGSRAAAVVAELKRDYTLKEAAAWPIDALGLHCIVVELPPGRSRDDMLEALRRDARVQLAQPLQEFELHGRASSAEQPYNDPYAHLQRGFVETGAAQAHRISVGRGVRIAVIDSGIDAQHPDLRGRLVAVQDYAPAQGDSAGVHGTQVAGVIAAVGNNALGIVGMAPQAQLSIYRACWQGTDGMGRCNSFTLAKALAAVIQSDAQVINLSLGGPGDPLLEQLLDVLLKQGRFVVAAVPPDGRRRGFPTAAKAVLAVRASGMPAGGEGVLVAPGRDILTLRPGGGYDFASGASLAAAHVSGIVALLLAASPQLDTAQVLQLLRSGSRAAVGEPAQVSAIGALEALDAASARMAQLPPAAR
jgi:subtilisin family serine protease